jgi:vitamin B12 transporter
MSFELIAYYREVEDLIEIDFDMPAYPEGLIVNSADTVDVIGAELILGMQLGESLDATLDYTWTQAESDGANHQIQDIPRYTVKLILEWSPSSLPVGATLVLNKVGDAYDSVSGGIGLVEHGNYTVADIGAHWFIDAEHRHRLGLRLENAFDEDYATSVVRVRRDSDGTSYPAGNVGVPRTLHASYTFSF